jgi:ABC-type uncharacterized transport system auxiliary subunit
MIKIFAMAVTLLIFSGCMTKELKPTKFYTISNSTEIEKSNLKIDKVLKVSRVKSPDYLNSSDIYYQKNSNEINAYLYSKFNDDLTDIIEQDITSTLYKSELFRSVYNSHSKIRSDLILEVKLVNAVQKVGDDSIVELDLRLYLIRKDDMALLGSKEFLYRQKSDLVNAEGAINAYNKIIKKFNKDMTSWLEALVTEN